mgnify:CR=1 FL=1
MNWKTLTKTARRTLSRNSSKILLGLGIAGAFTAVGFAISATPKAMILLEEKKQELGVEKLDAKTIIKTAAPVYIPTAISMGISTGCIIAASSVNDRRNAALAAAYTMSETALRSYQDKVVETVGPEKAKEIKEAVALDKMAKCPEPKNPPVATPQKPDIGNDFYNEPVKCWESLSLASTTTGPATFLAGTRKRLWKSAPSIHRNWMRMGRPVLCWITALRPSGWGIDILRPRREKISVSYGGNTPTL